MAGLLDIAGVHTFYGHIEALRGVNMTVAEGEIVTLIGANGAGKSPDGRGHRRPGALRCRSGEGADAVPDPAPAPGPEGRNTLGRRAADVGHRARPHEPSPPVVVG